MRVMEKFFIKNEKETSKLAKILAKEILKIISKKKNALVIGLEGDLGAGKTTFIKAFAKGMGIRKRLTSPTFVLLKKYKNLYHIDCYRIKNAQDILALDFEEIISLPKNIVLIEWAEKIRKILPKDKIWIKFEIVSDKKRIIKFI
jgi:tRNA threonylcarbamoyladenosine biosynthesis protein TsaE